MKGEGLTAKFSRAQIISFYSYCKEIVLKGNLNSPPNLGEELSYL